MEFNELNSLATQLWIDTNKRHRCANRNVPDEVSVHLSDRATLGSGEPELLSSCRYLVAIRFDEPRASKIFVTKIHSASNQEATSQCIASQGALLQLHLQSSGF